MILFLVSFIVIALVMAAMAVGVMFGRSAIRGSCGGVNNGQCLCVKQCEKRRKAETEGA